MASNLAPAVAPKAANAWAKPLKAPVAGPPPGMGKGGKGQNYSNNNNSLGSQNALRERFIGLSLNMVGHKVVVTQTNGAVFEGIFHTFCPFASLPADKINKYVIKACRVIKPLQKTDESDKQSQVEEQATVIIGADKVACLTAKSMRIETLSSNGSEQQKGGDVLRTDTEISGFKGGQQRELVAAGSAWTSGGSGGGGNSRVDALMGGLASKDGKGTRQKRPNSSNANTSGLKGRIGEWDQFQANQELFNVKGTFDENLYTTELDKSQIDSKKIAEAERLAREIENTATTNVHLAEERGHKLEGDFDEEDLYSGVIKDKDIRFTIVGSDGKLKNDLFKSEAPKMNYAAAAKADLAKKTAWSGAKRSDSLDATATEPEKETQQGLAKDNEPITAAKTETKKPAQKSADAKAPESQGSKDEKVPSEKDAEEKTVESNSDSEKKTAKPASKLNANAKSFTLSAAAPTFTPGAPVAPAGGHFDLNAAMHLGQVPGHMPGAPQYMHGPPMGQPGMMHMMPQYHGGVRYQGGAYIGMEQQHLAQMQPTQAQTQQLNPSTQGSGAPSPASGSTEDGRSQAQPDSVEGAAATSQPDATSQPQSQGQAQQPPPQHMVVYGVPHPGAYYHQPGMPMPRGPGAPHQGFHPQFIGGPQIPGGPGGAPYRMYQQVQPGGMAPNAPVRPGYYGGPPPLPFPPAAAAYGGNNMTDEDPSFRGGGRVSGRGGRPSSGRGRIGRGRGGRGRNYNQHQHGGRHSGQNPNQNQNNAASQAEADDDKGASSTKDPPDKATTNGIEL